MNTLTMSVGHNMPSQSTFLVLKAAFPWLNTRISNCFRQLIVSSRVISRLVTRIFRSNGYSSEVCHFAGVYELL